MNLVVFSNQHIISMLTILLVLVVIIMFGIKLNKWQRQFIAIILAIITISVEFFDDIYRLIDGRWLIVRDLPLHLCGFSTFLSAYALYKRSQLAFEFTFFWGIGGAIQAIVTPEVARFYTPYYFYISQISHSIIILNVLWMFIVLKMKIGHYALHRTVLLTLFLMVVIGIFNVLISANYFFLCEKPDIPNPFLIGEWPFYLISLIFFGILVMFILDIIVKNIQSRYFHV